MEGIYERERFKPYRTIDHGEINLDIDLGNRHHIIRIEYEGGRCYINKDKNIGRLEIDIDGFNTDTDDTPTTAEGPAKIILARIIANSFDNQATMGELLNSLKSEPANIFIGETTIDDHILITLPIIQNLTEKNIEQYIDTEGKVVEIVKIPYIDRSGKLFQDVPIKEQVYTKFAVQTKRRELKSGDDIVESLISRVIPLVESIYRKSIDDYIKLFQS